MRRARIETQPLSRVDLQALVLHLVEVFNCDPAKGMLPLMMLAPVVIGVAVPVDVPPTVPATVWPLLVPVGCCGSVTM